MNENTVPAVFYLLCSIISSVYSVPDCPVNINNTMFVQPCTYQNEETCSYVCNDGYQPTTDDSSMKCVDTFWIPETPCAKSKHLKLSSYIVIEL